MSALDRVKSPSFWLTILGSIGSAGTYFLHTPDPVFIAIGAALTAVYTFSEHFTTSVAKSQSVVMDQALPAIKEAIADVKSGDVTGAIGQAGALVPVVQDQVGAVQTLVKEARDTFTLIKDKLEGYEVTPHVDTPETAPQVAAAPVVPDSVGGQHEVIGGKPA